MCWHVDISIEQHLLVAGEDPNARTGTGESMLQLAMKAKTDISKVEYLLAAGADPNAGTKTGEAILHSQLESILIY